ncbi:deoxyribonuclease HsdR [Adhaeribacter arboris]|uniref:Deoxyribonuclease HsdR n=1 Tax=Adhaeribacter arboris TaxID=2072846 RepID=A0A2T2YH66_9BACT|nr:trypsin-like peptidase domain-containing protein [Adhaeribacter arboris]PSR54849.1 deoxyribonuclease HsdR [Adhaeribacter arboris]
MKTAGLILITALISAVLAVAGFKYLDKRESPYYYSSEEQPVRLTNYSVNGNAAPAVNPNFVQAASAVSPAVVHIKTTYASTRSGSGNPLEDFFGSPQSTAPAMASGSGVLITPDGYIVTNNHVIEDASQIEVVLPDKRSYKAKLIGRDPSTDLALVKVDAANLPIVELGNSDEVQVGEWVLAVGYPLSLNSTVTAGIVSAKGRSIGILNRQSQEGFSGRQAANNSAIESFIQTDAAINPGNSGGALINATGQLVGINAAIASQTGSYAGYGFAIPVNLVKKVVSDFRKYGEVKRGYLGVSFPAPAVEDQILREQGIDPASIKGVYITGIQSGSGAAAAGIKAGDIIQSIDGVKVASSAEFSERIARHRPGDKVEVTYLRGGRTNTASITLKGEEANREIASNNGAAGLQSKLGAAFAPIPANIKERYRLRSGVIITEVQSGGFFDSAGIPKGTIITSINGRPVNSLADLDAAIGSTRSRMVRIDGITPDGTGFVFNFPLGA